MSGDFDYGILDQTGHRPWPMPDAPWLMTQTWHDLLFAHWPIDPASVRPKVPAAFEIDLFQEQAWLGVVPFRMTNVVPRGLPALPWVSAFPELNVRTYVRAGNRAGVYFFSLDAANPLAVRVARTFVHLPYYTASMQCRRADGWVHYRSERSAAASGPARFAGRYRASGPIRAPHPGTIEHFLTERYCLFTLNRRGAPLSLDIHHPRWPLQPAEARLDVNTMAQANGLHLPATTPLLHFAERLDVVTWGLARLERSRR